MLVQPVVLTLLEPASCSSSTSTFTSLCFVFIYICVLLPVAVLTFSNDLSSNAAICHTLQHTTATGSLHI
jgi:membrane-anchored glycerophosphoryl diester phosphodiesterase (GDPDase)